MGRGSEETMRQDADVFTRPAAAIGRRAWLFLWILAVFLGSLAGCQSATTSSDVTIRFTVWDGDESLKVLRAVVKDFERENPGIKVKVENFGDYNLYHQKMLTQYAAGVAPDVAMMDPGHFQALAKRDAIYALNQFFDQTPGFDIDAYYKTLVDMHSYKGNVYVLPRDIAPMGLIYYNKSLFDKAGLPYPDGSWTWDFEIRPELREKDFLWVMEQLKEVDGNGKVTQWAFVPDWIGFFMDTLAFGYGLDYADDIENPTKVKLDDPGWTKIYEFYEDLTSKKRYLPNQSELTNVVQSNAPLMFISGDCAMMQSGIWQVPNIRKSLKPGEKGFFEWDIALAPAYAKGERRFPTGGSGYSIFKSTKHPEAAWKLVQYMAGKPGMIAMAKAGIAQPGIRELALSDAWLPGPNTPIEQRYPPSRILTDQAVQDVALTPNSDLWPEINGIIGGRISAIYSGTTPAKEAIAQAQKESQARLDVLRGEQSLPPFPWAAGVGIAALIAGAIAGYVYWPERNRKLTWREKRESRSAYLFIFPWLFGFITLTLGPMLLSLLMSFADWDIIREARWRGVGNYHEAFVVDPRVLKSLTVTLVYTFFSVPIGLIFALILAMLLNQKVRGVPLFRAMYYLPSLASLVAASLIWRRIFSAEGGLLNQLIFGDGTRNILGFQPWLQDFAGKPGESVNWLGSETLALPSFVIMSLWGVGGGMVILLAGLQGIPQHYYEAATVDGAGPWHKFKNVTLPLLTPAIFFSLVTGFIGSFQTFAQAFVMTGGGPNDATLLYMLHLYNQAFTSLRMGYASALAWLLFFIILIFTVIQFKGSKWVYYESDVKR